MLSAIHTVQHLSQHHLTPQLCFSQSRMQLSPNLIFLFISLASALPAPGAGQSSEASFQVSSSEDNASQTDRRRPGSLSIHNSDGSIPQAGSEHQSTDRLIPGEQSEHQSVHSSESQDTLCDCQLAKPKKKGLMSSKSILTITLKSEDNLIKLDLQMALTMSGRKTRR